MPAALVAVMALVVGLRIAEHPVSSYGLNGVEYKQHAERLAWAERVREHEGAGWISTLDGEFPPGLYAWAELLTPVLGRAPAPLAAASSLWLLLLAGSLASLAWSLSRRWEGAVSAFCIALLVPAFHGSALRFYFDLPLAALSWAAVAVLVGVRREGVAGLAAGALAVAATAVKWTALPVLGPLLIGGALWKRRGRGLGIALAIWAVAVAGWLGASDGPGSLHRMATEARVVDLSAELEGEREAPGVLGIAAGVLDSLVSPGRSRQLGARVVWYAGSTATSALSPVLAVLLLVGAVGWLRMRDGWPVILLGLLGHAAFVLLLVAPLDQRFVLPSLPLLILPAALGWRRRALAGAFVIAALLVAVDFHHAPTTPLTSSGWTWLQSQGQRDVVGIPVHPLRWRGIGAASSFEGRGWSRRDEDAPQKKALRRALLAELERCAPERIISFENRPLLGPRGDGTWLEYLALQQRVEGRGPGWATSTVSCEATARVDRGLVLVQGDEHPANCGRATWRRLREVADPDGGQGIGLWASGLEPVCSSGSR